MHSMATVFFKDLKRICFNGHWTDNESLQND